MAPSHVKRDYDTWTDELTHSNPTGFTPLKEAQGFEGQAHALGARALLSTAAPLGWAWGLLSASDIPGQAGPFGPQIHPGLWDFPPWLESTTLWTGAAAELRCFCTL